MTVGLILLCKRSGWKCKNGGFYRKYFCSWAIFYCRRCLFPSYLCFFSPDFPNPTYVPAARAIWRFVTTIVFIKTRIPSTTDGEYNYHDSLNSPARRLAGLGRVSRAKAAEQQLRAGDAGEKNEAPHSSRQFLVAVSLLLPAIPYNWACSQAKIAYEAGRRRARKSKWALWSSSFSFSSPSEACHAG